MNQTQMDIADRLLEMSKWVVHNSIEQLRNEIALEAYEEVIKLRRQVASLEQHKECNED